MTSVHNMYAQPGNVQTKILAHRVQPRLGRMSAISDLDRIRRKFRNFEKAWRFLRTIGLVGGSFVQH
jgi:hypothetical protein